MALKPARLQWSDDGTLRSLDYGDIYFQRGKGLAESQYTFVDQNGLPDRFRNLTADRNFFAVSELGFGSGLNFLLTLKSFAENAPQGAAPRLLYASIEKHPIERQDLARVLSHFALPGTEELLAQYPPLIEGFHHLHFLGGRVRLMLLLGDVAEMLPQLQGKFDAWFLDGFSPEKNPEMWEESLFPLIAARTAPGGTVATFSSASRVRNGLSEAGFLSEKSKGYGIKRVMTVAHLPGAPLSRKRKKITVLGAGIAGCAVAHALKLRGHTVTLRDRLDSAAAAASGNPAAILYPKLTVDPSPMGQYHSHAFCYARGLLEQLNVSSWKPCGVKHLDGNAEGAARRRELFARNAFPDDYCAETEDGYLQPSAGMVAPAEFCRALAGDVAAAYGAEALDLSFDGADAVVIALGPESKSFPETEWLPLQPVRGQLTLLRPTPESQKLESVICHDGYITPLIGGLHCIGATFQKNEEGGDARAEDDAENLEKLNARLPQFLFTPAHIAGSRSGTRAATPDRLPLVGPCPDYDAFRKNFEGLRTGKQVMTDAPPYIPNLYVTTGFGAHGMTGAPLAGEIIACLMSDEPLPVPLSLLEQLLPERFIFRGLKRKQI